MHGSSIARPAGRARTLLTLTFVLLLTASSPAEAATCSLRGKERQLGPTYTTSLRVTATSCLAGQRLVRAYYRCRVRAGGKRGTCRRRVSDYRCSERRSNVIATQFDARVSCRRGRARVIHTYTQFT